MAAMKKAVATPMTRRTPQDGTESARMAPHKPRRGATALATLSFATVALALALVLSARLWRPTRLAVVPQVTAAATPSSRSRAPRNATFCERAAGAGGVCVFDIGHNSGQDTRFYLGDAAHPRAHVLAVDANPQLMAASRRTFAPHVAAERLVLVTVGLVSEAEAAAQRRNSSAVAGAIGEPPAMTFFRNVRQDKFSSFDERLGCRDGWGVHQAPGNRTFCRVEHVPTCTCASLVRRYGAPRYAKIDIEGRDLSCLSSLQTLPPSLLPPFLSVENVHESVISQLKRMGYVGFKAVDQFALNLNVSPELEGYSGPWGHAAEDFAFGRRWLSAEEMLRRLPLPRRRVVDGKERTVWFDLHAMRS